MPIFRDNSNGKELFVSRVSFKEIDGVKQYYDKRGNKLVGDDGRPLENISAKKEGVPTIGKFESMTPKERQKVLSDRSKKHFAPNKDLFHLKNTKNELNPKI